jgi:hypothetical protein
MTPRIRVSRMIARVRDGVADMSYAQRRAFENQTGIAVPQPRDRSHGRRPDGTLRP